ncbi:AbiJ-NTD4 domain-containing protein [Rhodopseudomonas palustris]|uniref:AbiJ-NTD4 domain-containing protein n=1 Tax=Rhodopseudomonas palustris TaxID=1076 RepID=UPI0011C3F4A4|nr:hypothetical protein [Rhodopseudomonas palustris]
MNSVDRTKVSFAEAEGKSRFPPILQWGEIDERLRSGLWNVIYLFLKSHIKFNASTRYYSLVDPAASILIREHVHRRYEFFSDYTNRFSSDDVYLNNWADYFRKRDYIELFDFITFLVRDPDCPAQLIERIAYVLDEPYSPYRLSISAKTIYPAIDLDEAKSLERDVDAIFASAFSGAKTHIRSSLENLGGGDYRAVVRESIHAVESAVREYTGDPAAIVSKATKSLVAELGVHRALADAFDKLYAYSNDEKGIRHALVFQDNEKVGLDEAVFFLSACTAFVGFLSRKKLKIGDGLNSK